MFNDYDDLLTIEELCSILLIGKNAAYTLLKTKQIKAFRIGRGWRVPKKSVELYILNQSGLNKK
ncbi:DNA binding domain, excisionase family [Clostridiales bacterium 1_7_47FAA]|uniref:Helix-turn-helix domain-containing protein n=1 Tax=Enterocloster hominis (ex Hitch et al. 2024) TaxID=1917870 RepID=A0ABV1D5X2_9FIRM|nr:DNA binding domain, excisionase family [Clostridiales bacterium 1_7_47FAA]